jgi:hypothetical protein
MIYKNSNQGKTGIFIILLVLWPILLFAYTPPVGIPDPGMWGSNHPIDATAPAKPGAWPSAEVTDYYYIDSTNQGCSDGNTYGYPDVPRCSIEEKTYSAGSYVFLRGGPYEQSIGDKRLSLFFDCTEASPCWFRGESNDKPIIQGQIRLRGSYLFVENIHFRYNAGGLVNIQAGDKNESPYIADHMIFRNNEVEGDGQYHVGFGSAFYTSKKDDLHDFNGSHHIIWYGNHIHDLFDDDYIEENDYHGILPGQYSRYLWILNNHIHDNSGDSLQIGSNNFAGEQMPRYIYVGNNECHGDLENAIDVKNAKDVIISSNLFYDYHLSPASDGTAVVIHQQNGDIPERIWVINNKIHTATRGIRVQQTVDAKIIGNIIYNIHFEGDPADWKPNSAWTPGSAIQIRDADSTGGEVINNTIFDYDLGIQSPTAPPSGFKIAGNLFANRAASDGYEINMDTADARSSDINYNFMYNSAGIKIMWDIDFASISDFIANTSNCDDCPASANPEFINGNQNNFHIPLTSPVVDKNIRHPVYDTFKNLYGLEIAVDISNVSRPQGNGWDIGAYESYETKLPAPAITGITFK